MKISNIHTCLNLLKVQLKVYTLKNLEVAGIIFFNESIIFNVYKISSSNV